MSTPADKEDAQAAFEAYNESAGGLTFDGRPIPAWNTLVAQGSRTVDHWRAAVRGVDAHRARRAASPGPELPPGRVARMDANDGGHDR